ncbi:glycosyltransferase [Pelagibacteraceae bacterium]|nr:glycosyltransferase [Pelagibacteraceae bacterium]
MKSRDPLISVIINCHNGEKFLQKSVNSILSQSYKNFEIIFWDNNSTDTSKKIIKNITDKRIKYFKSKKFKKLYECRNLAIKKAKGKYISFLDVDDWWTKDKLKKQVSLIKKNKDIKIVYSNFFIFSQKNKKKYLKTKKKLLSGMITKKIISNYNIGILTTMINRDIFDKFRFDPKYQIISDFDFFIKLSLRYPFYAIQKPLAYYRVHTQNFSKKKSNLYIQELKIWMKSNKDFFSKKNIDLLSVYFFIKKLQLKNFFIFIGGLAQK